MLDNSLALMKARRDQQNTRSSKNKRYANKVSGRKFFTGNNARANLYDVEDSESPWFNEPVRGSVDLQLYDLGTPSSRTLPDSSTFLIAKHHDNVKNAPLPDVGFQTRAPVHFSPLIPTAVKRWTVVRDIMDKWTGLQEDWDFDGALPPSADQIEAAYNFIKKAEQFGIREPQPYIASDSEIGFHWIDGLKASVSFLIDDRFLAFCPIELDQAVRVSGPLDIASGSAKLFRALAKRL